MKIHQILNNNVITTIDVEGQEFIAMGNGLAFSKKVGDKVNSKDIEKFFVHKKNLAGASMLGEIIKDQRMQRNMTRKTLAEGIFSQNDLYLIEKNEKGLPIYQLNALSDKLAIDLFEYYEFFNYKDREKVLQYRENFEKAMKSNDLETLREESRLASQLKDFQSEPLIYEIKIINYAYTAFVKGQTSEVIKELNKILEKKNVNIDPITLLNVYIVLSSAYQIEGRWDEAGKVVEIITATIKNKIEFARYRTVIISALISVTSFLYRTEQYDELIKYSKCLIEFHEEHSEYNRMYYVEFFFSFAYYKKNEIVKSKEHFMRGLYSILLFKNKIGIGFILKMKELKEVSESLNVDQKLIGELYEIIKSPDN